jgi:subtilisin-like proprotein convertase family protein
MSATESGSTTTDSGTGTASTSSGTDTSTTGGGGAACSGDGDLSVNGAGGGANANQNCPSTLFSVLVQNAPGPVADVDVELQAVAANTSENRLWLKSPLGTEVLLFDRRGNFLTDDFFGTIFDDQSATPVAAAPGPFHGCYSPEQALSAFDGQAADGTWTLRVETCLYETTVQSWTLNLDF